MGAIRRPAVAGSFYPADPDELRALVEGYLRSAGDPAGPPPKAIIAPHAGFIYSGPIAATAYARLRPGRDTLRRVVLMGPSHRVPFHGLAVTSAEAYVTPLGSIPVDREAVDRLLALPDVGILDAAHVPEHSLEVHLPFLQLVLDRFTLVPIVAGQATPQAVASVLDAVWGGPETVIVISSDLSHYLEYDRARALDDRTRQAIETLNPAAIGHDQACGRVPISGLLTLAKTRHLSVETLDVRNSGDTAGPRSGVVGYGAWAFCEEPLP
jgi:AmmeMemoRadiSam system protein B